MRSDILITGSAGFVASHYTEHILRNTDYNVWALDRLEEPSDLSALYHLHREFPDRLHFVFHDLRSEKHIPIRKPLKYVVHMAASSHVVRSIRAPLQFVHDNVVGTANLLEWVRVTNPDARFLYFSTDEVYGPALADLSFTEADRLAPANPYAATKAAADVLMSAWANTFGMDIVRTRCTNVYGPRQHAEKFIPLCTELVKRGAVVPIHARGGRPASRYYVYVEDVCRATSVALELGSGTYNISGTDELDNLDVAQQIAALLQKPLNYDLCEAASDRPRHDQCYRIDSGKLGRLGWSPQVSFAEGLKRTVLDG